VGDIVGGAQKVFMDYLFGRKIMKRDMELIYKILAFYEEKDDFVDMVTPEIDGYSENEMYYHLKLMGQARLLEVKDWSSLSSVTWVASSLTHYGHDFFDALRQESVWNTIKTEFKDASLETIISVSKQLAEGWAKKKVETLLGKIT
jgi:hypothetical protein